MMWQLRKQKTEIESRFRRVSGQSNRGSLFISLSVLSLWVLGFAVFHFEASFVSSRRVAADYNTIEHATNTEIIGISESHEVKLSTKNWTLTEDTTDFEEPTSSLDGSDADMFRNWLKQRQHSKKICDDREIQWFTWHPRPSDTLADFLQSWKNALIASIASNGLLVPNGELLAHPVANALWQSPAGKLLPEISKCSAQHLPVRGNSTTSRKVILLQEEILDCAIVSPRVLQKTISFQKRRSLVWIHREVSKFIFQPTEQLQSEVQVWLENLPFPEWMDESAKGRGVLSVHLNWSSQQLRPVLVSGRVDSRSTARKYYMSVSNVVLSIAEWRGISRVVLWNDLHEELPKAFEDLQWLLHSLPGKTSVHVVKVSQITDHGASESHNDNSTSSVKDSAIQTALSLESQNLNGTLTEKSFDQHKLVLNARVDLVRLVLMASSNIALGSSDSSLSRTIAELVVPSSDSDHSQHIYDTLQQPYFSCQPKDRNPNSQ